MSAVSFTLALEPHGLRQPTTRDSKRLQMTHQPGNLGWRLLHGAHSGALGLCAARLLRGNLRPRCSRTVRRSRETYRRTLIFPSVLGGAAAHAEVGQSEGPAQQEDAARVQRNTIRLRNLGQDPEVQLLRRLQDQMQLFDTARGQFVSLMDTLRSGEKLHDADLVCIGEQHDSEADHTIQRVLLDALTYALLCELRSTDMTTPQNLSQQKVAVGVEYFYREQQDVLDALVFGGMPVKVFQEQSYFSDVWNYDWSLYRPLFRYVQLNKNQLVGLNIPMEKVRAVSKSGVSNVSFKDELPSLDLSKSRHRQRFEDMMRLPVETVLDRMKGTPDFLPNPKLDRVYQSQCLWEEYMSETANRYLQANGGRMVVFAGFNHAWRDGIPDRFERQSLQSGKALKAVTIVPWRWGSSKPEDLPRFADYILCMAGSGGGDELAATVKEQRVRLSKKERVFPAGFL